MEVGWLFGEWEQLSKRESRALEEEEEDAEREREREVDEGVERERGGSEENVGLI